MASYKTSAIVLGRHNLGEADRIVALLTPDYGVVRAVARGVRKPLSRQAGHIEPFSQAELMLAEGRNLDIITSARLVWYPDQFASDYDRLQLAFLMTRMIERLSGERHPAEGLHRLLSYSLRWLDDSGASPSLELFFKLRLLETLGYKPRVEVCSRCGRPFDRILASPEHGGMVCATCAEPGDVELSADQLGLWRRLLSDGLEALAPGDEARAEATVAVADSFYQYWFGRSFSLESGQ